MDLAKLFEMQKALDDRIIKEKKLEGQDLFSNTILALDVELSEFANEGRWFKHWSNNQKPRTKAFRGPFIDSEDSTEYNPVLEEYIDCLHFFLSIAIQKGWQDAMYLYADIENEDEFDGDLTGIFLEVKYFLIKSYMEKYPDSDEVAGFQKNAYFFRLAWTLFLVVGSKGFSFTLEQIEQAYMEKNVVNHKRQENGY